MNDNVRLKKFEELAEKRVNETIKRLRLIGNLSNKKNYIYTEEHSRQIFKALDEELKILKLRFQGKDNQEVQFRFKIKSKHTN